MIADERPTVVRHVVLWVATLMAVLLYLDRYAVGIAAEYIREDMRMTQTQMSWFQGAFFWSYALFQVPAGWFSDRYGARKMLTIYILAWSAFTGFLGLTELVWVILALRLLCGVSQAGAYPTAGGMIRIWYPLSGRGVASSIVALGGRAGGVLAPLLTAWLIIIFSQVADPMTLSHTDIVNDKSFLSAFEKKPNDPRAPVIDRLVSRFPESIQQSLSLELKKLQSESADSAPPPDNRMDVLLSEIAALIRQPDLFTGVDVSRMKLVPETAQLVEQRAKGTLPDADARRLNRLIVEAAFPGSIKRFRGIGWRPTMMSYGLVGIVVAIIYYLVTRDHPRTHPWCNSAEQNLIEEAPPEGTSTAAPPHDPPFPLGAMLTSVGLWGNSLMQFFTNIGWLFVMTALPRYLEKVHGISLAGQAIMTAIPTAAGILGMYLGGWWTDLATHYAGRKWGRRLPVLITRFTAGLGYGICLFLSIYYTPDSSTTWLPWAYVAALCLMTFSVDMGNPAIWGYAQDVGGKFTGSILGWANMWGNLGAAVAPPIYNAVLGETPDLTHWTLMFGVCTLAFVISGIFALALDSTKPLVKS